MNQIMAASMVGQQGKFFVLKQPPLPQKAFSNRITQKNNKKKYISNQQKWCPCTFLCYNQHI